MSLGTWKGTCDLVDEVIWTLYFKSDRQATRVRQDNSITDDMWNVWCKLIRSEPRLPTARAELERLWKERVAKDIAKKGEGASSKDEDDDNLTLLIR